MSVYKDTYVIFGYDLSRRNDEIITEELVECDKYEAMVCNQRPGFVQLFTDPMSGSHLYAGYIIGKFEDDSDDKCVKVDLSSMERTKQSVDEQLFHWGIQIKDEPFEIIMFNEFS